MTTYFNYQRTMKLFPVPESAVDAAIAHMKSVFPLEGVGAVWGDKFMPLLNHHETPQDGFRLGPDYARLVVAFGEPQAVIHSHPNGVCHPSKTDLEAQALLRIPYGIVALNGPAHAKDVFFWGDDIPAAPYEGRPFKHGIYDCYELLRDFYRHEFTVRLPRYPREPEWWNNPNEPSLFEDNFKAAGFEEIELAELRYGDVLLMRIFGMDRINHCAVYKDKGLIVHQIYGSPSDMRLSSHDNIYRWRRYIRKALRFAGGLHLPTSHTRG